ncbi:hypothetical protein [Haloferax profundi]|uniref:hypothetical protein n=1 Tax=Haloferax profundi TaxID=1544718 RepID=UPI000A4F012E|nr:hypothetical protein [Haloferax profundi]
MNWSSRRDFLYYPSVIGFALMSGCLGNNGGRSETTPGYIADTVGPERVKGESIELERTTEDFEVELLDDGSIQLKDEPETVPFEEWVESTSVEIAKEELSRSVIDRAEKGEEALPVVHDAENEWLLLTTKTYFSNTNDDIAFPSSAFIQVRDAAPSSVSVSLTLEGRSNTITFPVYIRAILEQN